MAYKKLEEGAPELGFLKFETTKGYNEFVKNQDNKKFLGEGSVIFIKDAQQILLNSVEYGAKVKVLAKGITFGKPKEDKGGTGWSLSDPESQNISVPSNIASYARVGDMFYSLEDKNFYYIKDKNESSGTATAELASVNTASVEDEIAKEIEGLEFTKVITLDEDQKNNPVLNIELNDTLEGKHHNYKLKADVKVNTAQHNTIARSVKVQGTPSNGLYVGEYELSYKEELPSTIGGNVAETSGLQFGQYKEEGDDLKLVTKQIKGFPSDLVNTTNQTDALYKYIFGEDNAKVTTTEVSNILKIEKPIEGGPTEYKPLSERVLATEQNNDKITKEFEKFLGGFEDYKVDSSSNDTTLRTYKQFLDDYSAFKKQNSAIFNYRGSVNTFDELAQKEKEKPIAGDVWNVKAHPLTKLDEESGITQMEGDGGNYVWNGHAWDKLGGLLQTDLKDYSTTKQVEDKIDVKLTKYTPLDLVAQKGKLNPSIEDQLKDNATFVETEYVGGLLSAKDYKKFSLSSDYADKLKETIEKSKQDGNAYDVKSATSLNLYKIKVNPELGLVTATESVTKKDILSLLEDTSDGETTKVFTNKNLVAGAGIKLEDVVDDDGKHLTKITAVPTWSVWEETI